MSKISTIALAKVKDNEPTFLELAKTKVKNDNTYVCPDCGNGSGKNGTGIVKYTTENGNTRYKCFKCQLNADIIDLWKITHNNKIDGIFDYFHIDNPYENNSNYNVFRKVIRPQQRQVQKTSVDYQDYFRECHKNVGNTEYWHSRGISDAVINKYNLGYDKYCKVSDDRNATIDAVIIPTSANSYVARNVNPTQKFRYAKRGSTHLFFSGQINSMETPIFVVEGEIDALSIAELGYNVIGLGSINNSQKLIDYFKENVPTVPIILALDNDEAGEKAQVKLEEDLKNLKISCYCATKIMYMTKDDEGYIHHKDANEALLTNREQFEDNIEKYLLDVAEHELNKTDEPTPEEAEYLNSSNARYLQDFIGGLSDDAATEAIPTGFPKLDRMLDGGLYPGLTILGSSPSMGKTTFALQVGDNIARDAQRDVLIFSLEMARNELISKSLSRNTAIISRTKYKNKCLSKTAREITNMKKWEKYTEQENTLILDAMEAYNEYADHLFVNEGIGDVGTAQIRETIEKHIKFRKQKPVVIIDYLQILDSDNPRYTDKQKIDKIVKELRQISRDSKIPIIIISAFNRSGYRNNSAMESFMSSAGIEFSADVLIGLQLANVVDDTMSLEAAKKQPVRDIQLVILKNRYGPIGGIIPITYDAPHNFMYERNFQSCYAD